MPITTDEFNSGKPHEPRKHVVEVMEPEKGYSIPEIASLLDIHIASARQRLLRAQLKQLVDSRIVHGKTYWALTFEGAKYGNTLRYRS